MIDSDRTTGVGQKPFKTGKASAAKKGLEQSSRFASLVIPGVRFSRANMAAVSRKPRKQNHYVR